VNIHHINTAKTARICTLGNLDENTQEVWIVLHGYAQLSTYFLKHFRCVESKQRFFIAPEGLNRFYAKGFGGSPAASWMTSEDREWEIKDYLQYLDTVYGYFHLTTFNGTIHLLGFSQGVATASRWLHQTLYKLDSFVAYAGEIASELRNPISHKLLQLPITYVTGLNDRLLSNDKRIEVQELMTRIGARQIVFSGGHEITNEALLQLFENN
jgi:predicted esterase